MANITIPIGGMHCQHCVGSVKSALAALAGVKSVQVDLGKGQAVVEGEALDVAAIKAAIDDIGFEAGDPV